MNIPILQIGWIEVPDAVVYTAIYFFLGIIHWIVYRILSSDENAEVVLLWAFLWAFIDVVFAGVVLSEAIERIWKYPKQREKYEKLEENYQRLEQRYKRLKKRKGKKK